MAEPDINFYLTAGYKPQPAYEECAMMDATEQLRQQAFNLSYHEQFRLATFIAENVGYVLVGETEKRNPDIIWIDGERYKLTREDV